MSPGTGAFCGVNTGSPGSGFFLLFYLRETRAWFQQSISSDSLMLLNLSASLLNCHQAGPALSAWSCLTQLLFLLPSETGSGPPSPPQPTPIAWDLDGSSVCVVTSFLVGAEDSRFVPELLPRGWWPPRELTSSLGWLHSSCTPGHTNYLVTLPGLRLVGDLGCSGISQVFVAAAVRALTALARSEETPGCWDLSLP